MRETGAPVVRQVCVPSIQPVRLIYTRLSCLVWQDGVRTTKQTSQPFQTNYKTKNTRLNNAIIMNEV